MAVFSDLLRGVLGIDPAAPVIEYQAQWYAWGDLARTIGDIDALLAAIDLGRDARVGVMIRNRPSPFAAVLSAVAGEACMVSINPLLPDARLATDVAALRLPVVVAERGDLDRPGIRDALRAGGSAVIVLDGVLQGAAMLQGFETPGADVVRTDAGTAIEMLTSGTTGAPKRIPLLRTAFDRSFAGALSYERDRKPGDPAVLRPGTMILANPMTHIGGLWAGLTCIAGGRKAVLLEKFSVASWHDAVRRHRPKVASAVPAGLRMLLDAGIPAEDLSSLVAIRTGAAPVDPAVVDEFLARYDIPVLQNYGATEFSGAVAGWTLKDFRAHWHDRRGAVGRFQPGVAGRVVDADSGEPLAPGEEGVLEMQSRQFGRDDWVRTTDRAVIDGEGFLFVRGRADLAIIRGGFKVHPDDVNRVYLQHPAIAEAVTVGIADRRLGAVPMMAVILRDCHAAPTGDELAAFGRERLLPYQVPVRFLVTDDVPRTSSMKPALPQVRELFAD